MSDTLIHPVTGLRALGMGKRGPIWPVIGGNGEGGDPPTGEDPPADPPAAPPKPDDPPAGGDPKPDDEIDWKAMARKHEDRAKENAAAAKELAELKKSQMSDQQKIEASAKEASERAEKAERRAALAEAAITHGLDKGDLELLDGVPADQIEARAKKLAERLKKAAPPDASGREAGGDRGKKKATSLDSAVAGYYA